MTTMPGEPLLTLAAIAQKAGAVVMRHYAAGKNGLVDVRHKPDHSPVTDADEETERLILVELATHFPAIPVVAEEQAARGHMVRVGGHFFLVDPLDGTREFLKRNGEFTVNIAEVRDGVPVAGVVFAPAINRLFVGGRSRGAFEMGADLKEPRPISVRPVPQKGVIAVGSRSHGDEKTAQYLKQFDVAEIRHAGSSLKFCLVAAGEADLYPRAGRTTEWDTAAGHAVLAAAGGRVTCWDGAPFLYGKPGFENPGFIAAGRRSTRARPIQRS
jgi:3'(2'), 5'-bisphosphate nucleotidase